MSESNSTPREERSQSPPASNPSPKINPISCVDCRRRKIKCNKIYPCTNCEKSQLRCVFPPSRRLARGDSQELIAKIYRLETVIDSLRGALTQKDRQIEEYRKLLQSQGNVNSHQHNEPGASPIVQLGSPVSITPPPDLAANFETSPGGSKTISKSGKLIRDEGRSVYVSDSFWTTLITKVDEMGLSDVDSSEDDDIASQPSYTDNAVHDFPLMASKFGPTNGIHPSPEQRNTLWEIYKENVDPIVKVLHLPSIEPQVLAWMSRKDTENLPRNLNALLFAICFASVSSIEDDECLEILGEKRHILVARYRAAEEQALTAAGFLNTDDMLVMQSLVIYIATLRHSAPRLSWTLSSLAFRILQSLGAYCDDDSLSIPVLESEMRKRLSWHIFALETGAAEDFGCDPTMFEASRFNTPLPLNLNDADLTDETITKPEGRREWTQSTLLVLWADNCNLWRLIYDTRRHPEGSCKPLDDMTLKEKRDLTDRIMQRWDEQYIKPCSPLVPVQWVTANLARLLLLEFKLAILKPHAATPTETQCDEIFADAVEAMELCTRVSKDRRGIRWSWLMKTFISWRTLAYILMELGQRPLRKDSERAWSAVEQAMVTRWDSAHNRQGPQWRSMLNLLSLAREARAKEVRNRRESFRGTSDTIHAMLRDDEPRLHNMEMTAFEEVGLSTPRKTPSTNLGQAEAFNCTFFRDGTESSAPFSVDLSLDNPSEPSSLDAIGEFEFDSDVVDMDVSNNALFQAIFQSQDGFQMEPA